MILPDAREGLTVRNYVYTVIRSHSFIKSKSAHALTSEASAAIKRLKDGLCFGLTDQQLSASPTYHKGASSGQPSLGSNFWLLPALLVPETPQLLRTALALLGGAVNGFAGRPAQSSTNIRLVDASTCTTHTQKHTQKHTH